MAAVALPLPRSLSPSKVGAFKDCPLAFRFSAIDKLPEPPSPATLKGTLVHRALERLYWLHPPSERTEAAAAAELACAWAELEAGPELDQLELDDQARRAFRTEAEALVRADFQVERPTAVDAVGVELTVEADLGGLRLRGIIDRLDVDADGRLVVVDYKTGRVPSAQQEQARLAGVHFYALLCERSLGQRPAAVRLVYLQAPLVIEAIPTDQSIRGLAARTAAVWTAIERACATDDFRPRPSALCDWCGFRAWCPAQGGDLAAAPGPAPAVADPVPA